MVSGIPSSFFTNFVIVGRDRGGPIEETKETKATADSS